MSDASDQFYNNPLYQVLAKQSNYSADLLKQIHAILHEQPELARLSHPIEGSYFHIVCRNSNEHDKYSRII